MNLYGQLDPYAAGIFAQGFSVTTKYIYINGSKSYSNQQSGSITQQYGIILFNVDHARVNHAILYGNGTSNNTLLLGTNSDVVINN